MKGFIVEALMDVMVTVRSVSVILLILAFTLMVSLGALIAVENRRPSVILYDRLQKRMQQVTEMQKEVFEELDFWNEFKQSSGFSNTGEIVNRFYHNWDEARDGAGSNR